MQTTVQTTVLSSSMCVFIDSSIWPVILMQAGAFCNRIPMYVHNKPVLRTFVNTDSVCYSKLGFRYLFV